MSNTLTYVEVSRLPQVETSKIRELQWSMDWWHVQHEEAKNAANNAWRIYQEAIDEHYTREEINELLTVAMMFDGISSDAWHQWQNCKRDYLALCN